MANDCSFRLSHVTPYFYTFNNDVTCIFWIFPNYLFNYLLLSFDKMYNV